MIDRSKPENESRPTIATFASYDSSAAFNTFVSRSSSVSESFDFERALQRHIELPVIGQCRFESSDIPLLFDRLLGTCARNMSVK